MARSKNPDTIIRDTAVILDVVLENHVLTLRLANISAKPVTNVRVKFNRQIDGIGGRVNIGTLPIFTKLEFLAPGRVIDVPIERAKTFFANDKAEPLIAYIDYVDVDGHTRHAEMRHDLTVWRDMPEIG